MGIVKWPVSKYREQIKFGHVLHTGLLNPQAALWDWFLHHSSFMYEEKQHSKKQGLAQGQLEKNRARVQTWATLIPAPKLSNTPPTALPSGTPEQINPNGSPQRWHPEKLIFLFSHATTIENITAKLQHTTVLIRKTKMPPEGHVPEIALTGKEAHLSTDEITNSQFWLSFSVENTESDLENVFLLPGSWSWLKPVLSILHNAFTSRA